MWLRRTLQKLQKEVLGAEDVWLKPSWTALLGVCYICQSPWCHAGFWTLWLTREKVVFNLISTVMYQKFNITPCNRNHIGQNRLWWPCLLYSMQMWVFCSLSRVDSGCGIFIKASRIRTCYLQPTNRSKYYTTVCNLSHLWSPYTRAGLSTNSHVCPNHKCYDLLFCVYCLSPMFLFSSVPLKWKVGVQNGLAWFLISRKLPNL